jgi:hypothetical protein
MKSKRSDLTVFKPIDEMIDSEYGKITYEEWCAKEVKRINRSNFNIRYSTNHLGKKVCCIGK